MSTSGGDPYARLDRASERYRSTARWTVTAVGAVASVAFANFALGDIGQLTLTEHRFRLVVAVVCGIVAAAAFWFGISLTTRLSSASRVAADDLRKPDGILVQGPFGGQHKSGVGGLMKKSNGLTLGRESMAELVDDANAADALHARLLRERCDSPTDRALLQQIEAVRDLRRTLNRALTHALQVASTERLRATFELVKGPMVLALIVAVLAAVGIVWAANPPTAGAEVFVVGPQPTEAVLDVDVGARDDLAVSLGDACALDRVPVFVLGDTDGSPDVITVAEAGCAGGVRLTVEEQIGVLRRP